MKIRALLLTAAALPWLFAQEGHPLRGTWHGTWGPDDKTRTDVTLVMDWDGKQVTGIVNPGLRSAPMQKAEFDAPVLGVHFEVDLKDRAGNVTHAVVDAKIEELTNVHRRLVGTWTQGSQKGSFKAVRDN
jgi:hypothetical protein